MVAHKIEIAAELIIEGKRLYERTLTPLRDIAAFMGISRGTLEARIREWKWERRRHTGQSVSLLHAVRGAAIATVTGETATPSVSQPVSLEQRMALAARIQDAVEREIAAVERVLEKVAPADDSEVERSARTLASISRTLREIAALNQPDEVTPPDDTDDDPVPCDIDEFRRELARRIRGFIEAERIGAAGISGNAEAPLA